MRRPRFRFAPSPNGELHLGHAFSALFTQARARQSDGDFILRIEDIDFIRCRAAYADAILEDLRWLGIEWLEPVRRQSDHLGLYRDALARLDRMGLLYPCYASRQQVRDALVGRKNWPVDPDGAPLYPGLHKGLSREERAELERTGMPAAWRLDMDRALARLDQPLTFREQGSGPQGQGGLVPAHPERWGDLVLGRRDIGVSYHIAVVIDDAEQGIEEITRGQDLFHATGVHRLLQALLELPEPTYRHHRLIGDEMGRKLSKSAHDRSLRSLREEGLTAAEVRVTLGFQPS
ncbi:glutamyl-Q tRNA(Asp) synthetase [Rhodoligotrophos appendicifer]|uniref:tRNA glutamyl-Q(34) synthetase GluQRS n=1 Tax=Rhodoligotrophos appendicifer TaxID=987056 RepID=UPI001185D6B9|nr:tRNA glutamyl-Q(34) synthetase GluQRS [Rhodoligotrophos appendicifer]